ncbi:tRNA (adenosine(37)-N6)-dimethylallyltransferase MiaA [Patescibacteria group bacterium]|nr:tRNA (adenosine(37)-N6)-dimethylallyltransferase MiaA [Patescibacteria group bacterium]
MKELVVIVGPTASGKSELAVKLALRFGGEIVSADSRQVYKGLDIGAGKITKKEMRGVPHHLLDVASPKRIFTVVQYRRRALKAIKDIQKRGKLPFLVGGSPFYIYAVANGLLFPEVPPDKELRRQLEQYSAEKLYEKLQKLDPARAATLRQSSGQAKNKRRLIRALEIVFKTGKPVPELPQKPLPYPVLLLGIQRTQDELKKRIVKRLQRRFREGMVEEIQQLNKSGLSWKRLEELGLEYRYVAQYLQQKISRKEMEEKLEREIWKFSKRQMNWFKKDPRIRWIKDLKEAENLLRLSFEELFESGAGKFRIR